MFTYVMPRPNKYLTSDKVQWLFTVMFFSEALTFPHASLLMGKVPPFEGRDLLSDYTNSLSLLIVMMHLRTVFARCYADGNLR